MHRLHGPAAWIALSVLLGAAGCHLTGGLPSTLSDGHGRVDRAYKASLARSVRAVISTLDDLKVKPKDLAIRAIDAVSDQGPPGWAAATNSDYFPDNESFHDLFDKHRLNVAGAEPTPFNPVQVTYKGETEDGRSVAIIVRSQPPDASETLIMTRVGREGDDAWSRKFLDLVTERLPGSTKPAADALPALPAAK